MSKVLIVSGQFVPFTKSLGGILRVYAFSQSLVKKNHKVFLLVSKNSLNKTYGYLGLLKKDLRKIKIKYIQSKNTQISNSIFNFKLLRNIFYLLGFDYAFNLNNKYYEECLKIIESNNIDEKQLKKMNKRG